MADNPKEKRSIKIQEPIHIEAKVAATRAKISLEEWVGAAIQEKLTREQRAGSEPQRQLKSQNTQNP